MPLPRRDEINFEVNLTKGKWEPKVIEDIPKVVSRAFETDLSLRDIRPLIATDHVKTWPFNEDSDIPTFIKEKSMLNEAFAEKVVRFRLPNNVFPDPWQPKKVKILARGERVAKYFGEQETSERNVQVSLKLFDCGHFYLKQTLPGSGISPHWTIAEGTWENTEKGLKLTYLIRYTWQDTARQPKLDLNIEAVPDAGWTSTLAWSGEAVEQQLNGNIPAVCGTERWSWVEIYRDADKAQTKMETRFNDQMADDQSWVDGSWKSGLKDKDGKTPAQPRKPRVQPNVITVEGDKVTFGDTDSKQASKTERQSGPASSTGSSSAASTAKGKDSEESELPLYVALAIFVVILAYFAWQKMQEVRANWAKSRESGDLW